MRKSLGLREDSQRDFICSEHFTENCFDSEGRLIHGSVPTFFPQKSSKEHDHSYSGCTSTFRDSDVDDEVESLPTSSQSRHVTAEEEEIFSDNFFVGDDQNDSDFQPSEEYDSQSSDEFCEGIQQTEEDPIKCSKLIVFWSMLLPLFTICRSPGCGAHVDCNNISLRLKGACATVTSTCNNNHITKWTSSPLVGVGKYAVPLVNLLIGAYAFTSGLHVDQLLSFFSGCGVRAPAKTFMYGIQSTYLYKVVYAQYLRMQAVLVAERKLVSLDLGGDGQYDSPGFRARYCNYVIMDLATQKIISYFVAIKHQVSGGSGAMEPFAAKTCLLSLVTDCKLAIASFTTDRSSTIKTMMGSDVLLNSIKHEYDPWHWIKCVMKDVFEACKLKTCSDLAKWKDSITNMLWWSFATCKDENDLREKIQSIPLHCSNKHKFRTNRQHKQCAHGSLKTSGRTKPWLKEGSKNLEKLTAAINGKDMSRLNDLGMMTGFHHTGAIENFNSLRNKYAGKAYVYSYSGMIARTALAVIDHNSNVNRPQAVRKDGEPRTRSECDRGGTKWYSREVLVAKDTSWMDEIAKETILCVESRTIPNVELPGLENIPVNQSKVVKPEKSVLVAKHQTRLKKK